ncbi:MAG: hypothetical protein AAFV80_21440, partial [Bacteroidota bacterium]
MVQAIKGLPEFQDELELEAIEDITGEAFIEELDKRPETFKIGALQKVLWSGLKLPFRGMSSDQQNIGGVADLSNKGAFHQLLTSEFAYDDLTFLSRLANKEALYLLKESPPVQDKTERIFLIDITLKNWGVPKLLAFAAALAIAKHPKRSSPSKVFVVGSRFRRVHIRNANQVFSALKHIDTGLEPSAGLYQFFETPQDKKQEIILLGDEAVFLHPNLLRLFSDHGHRIQYTVQVNRAGKVDLYRYRNGNSKPIQQLQLPLSELWKRKKPFQPKQEDTLQHFQYPILLRMNPKSKSSFVTDDLTAFTISKFGSLLVSYNGKRYGKVWELIFKDLPFGGKSFQIGKLPDGGYMLLHYVQSGKQLVLINLNTKNIIRVDFPYQWRTSAVGFTYKEDAFYYVGDNLTYRIELDGKIELFDSSPSFKEHLTNLAKADKERTEEIFRPYVTRTTVLKRIKSVGINEHFNLQFNNHQFRLNVGQHIKFDLYHDSNPIIQAQSLPNGNFKFPDGTEVIVNPHGLICLKSSNLELAPVYIPTVLDEVTAAYADGAFAGVEALRKRKQYFIKVLNFKNSIQTIKVFKQNSQLGLKEIKTWLEDADYTIFPAFFYLEEAHEIRKKLDAIDCEARVFSY